MIFVSLNYNNEIHINSIAIDGDQEFEMIKNQTKNLSVTINPENTTDDKGVVWKTNNEEVETLSEKEIDYVVKVIMTWIKNEMTKP